MRGKRTELSSTPHQGGDERRLSAGAAGGGQNEVISINPELRPSGQNSFAEIKC